MPKKPNLKIFLSIYLIFILNVGLAQYNHRFHHYKTEQGLSNNVINCIIQDEKGFLWIGTHDGLNRFDGYSMKHFLYDKKDSSSISNNYITDFYIDNNNIMWITTDGGGLNRYDHIKQRFIRYQEDDNNPTSISSNHTKSICGDQDGNLWIATRDKGLECFNVKENKFYHYNTKNSGLLSDAIRTVFLDSKNQLWIGTYEDGISVLNTKTGEFKNYKYNPNIEGSLPDNGINCIYESKDGTIWIGTYSKGLCSYNKFEDKFHSYYDPSGKNGIETKSAKSIFEDSEGLLWIGTWAYGLYTFNRETNEFKHYTDNPNVPFQISDSRVLSICEDNTGQMWFGTFVGLNRLNKLQSAIKYYVHDKNNPNSLPDNNIYTILEDHTENVWVGTYRGGLSRYNRETGKFHHYQADPNNPNKLYKNVVWEVIEDSKHRIWVTSTGGILRYNPKQDNFIRYDGTNLDKNGIPGHNFLAMYEDYLGKFWLITWSEGVIYFDPETRESIQFETNCDGPYCISANEINDISEDHLHQLWIATDNGLHLLQRENYDFKVFKHNPVDSSTISNNSVNTIFEDSSNRLWIGTDNGLEIYNQQNSTFNKINLPKVGDELLIRNIIEDNDQNIWLILTKGLAKYNISEKSISLYDKQDGLQENQLIARTLFKGKDGRIYVGSNNGFNDFFPNQLKKNVHIPKVAITKFLLFNKEIKIGEESPLKANLNYNPEIVLNHKENVFSFEFSAMDFSQPNKNQYAYKLEGIHDEWIYTDYKFRRATFTHLSPGTYTFRVKASNNDGRWNEEGASVKVTILPPWWKTWWAKTIWISLILSIIGGAYLTRVNLLKQQKRKLKEQVKERTIEIEEKNKILEQQKNQLANINKAKDNMFAIIGHDLRGPVGNLISMLDMLTDENFDFNEEEKKHMLEVLSDSAKSAFSLLENLLTWSQSQRNIIKYSPETIKLKEVVQLDINLLKPAATNKNISLTSKIDEEITVFADNNMMKTVFRNLISNAIKFTGQDGKIEVLANQNNGTVEVHIKDNGIGIPKDTVQKLFNPLEHVTTKGTENEKGSGLGLMLCKELIERNRGTIRVESKINEGSTFIVSVPSKKP